MDERQLLKRAKQLLEDAGMPCGDARPETVAPDGSNRKFWRLPGAIAVAPETTGDEAMAEAVATWKIGSHLFARGCAVPQVYGFDRESGLLVMEDLGDSSLYNRVEQLKKTGDIQQIKTLYFEVIAELVKLQLHGEQGLQADWCWDSPCYDRKVMLETESGYFLDAWWQSLLGREAPPGIIEEFGALADRAAQAPAHFFLHRDCQSRNIFFADNKPKFIDFQGGRIGPLGYDLASLLMDPYVQLPAEMQEELFIFYLELLQQYGEQVSAEKFRFWYLDIALHRNLQIIGAFAFLSHQRKKMFFAQFIKPSVIMLRQRLAAPQFAQFTVLRQMVEQGL